VIRSALSLDEAAQLLLELSMRGKVNGLEVTGEAPIDLTRLKSSRSVARPVAA